MMSGSMNEESRAGAVSGRTLAEVEAEVEGAILELQRLRGERDFIPQLVEAATAELDAVRLGELEQRGRLLDAQIEAGQGRLFRLYAERARLQLPEAERQAEAARAEYDRAHAAYLAAHGLANRLGVESDNARVRVLTLKQAIEENEGRARGIARRLQAGIRGAQEGRP